MRCVAELNIDQLTTICKQLMIQKLQGFGASELTNDWEFVCVCTGGDMSPPYREFHDNDKVGSACGGAPGRSDLRRM